MMREKAAAISWLAALIAAITSPVWAPTVAYLVGRRTA